MADADPSVVAEVEAFCDRHQVNPASVDPTGLWFLLDDPDVVEIDAAVDELATRRNGTDPTE